MDKTFSSEGIPSQIPSLKSHFPRLFNLSSRKDNLSEFVSNLISAFVSGSSNWNLYLLRNLRDVETEELFALLDVLRNISLYQSVSVGILDSNPGRFLLSIFFFSWFLEFLESYLFPPQAGLEILGTS